MRQVTRLFHFARDDGLLYAASFWLRTLQRFFAMAVKTCLPLLSPVLLRGGVSMSQIPYRYEL